MRHLLMLSLFAVGGIALSAPIPKDKDKGKGEEAILGTWKVEKFEILGKQPPQEVLATVRIHFKKEGVLIVTASDVDDKGTFKIDATASPKTIDVAHENDKAIGIYELDGDTLKMCVCSDPQKARPKEFKATGERDTVYILKRVKEEPKK